MKNLEDLEKKLGRKFQKKDLIFQALVHRSYLNEAQGKLLQSNERLEFLGDSILSFVISEWLYEKFPDFPEGNLTNLRSNLVKTGSLAKIAKKFGIEDYLLLSKGEKKSGGQNNPVLLANCFEAIIGALFLDQGFEEVKKFIHQHFVSLLEYFCRSGQFKDYKSLLQENLQAENKVSPVYKTIKETGPDHAKIFTVAVYFKDKNLASGVGKTKQAAQQEAAKLALEKSK